MKMKITVLATVLIALPMLLANAYAQTPQKSSTIKIAGYPGEAQILQVNGKSYIEIESLARLTHGSLTFESNQTILTLPPADRDVQAPAHHARVGFSREFIQASIEELSVIREWRGGIVKAVQNNSPVPEDWISTEHRLADKNLALAAAAASTDDDRSAYPLLSSELNNMQNLSELYLTIRKQAAFISPDTFHNGPLEDQILNCAQNFVSMMGSHVFQDQTACH
jgi:hypothetical protein